MYSLHSHEHGDRKHIPMNLVTLHTSAMQYELKPFLLRCHDSAKNVTTEYIQSNIKSATVVLFMCNCYYIHSLSYNHIEIRGALVAMEKMVHLQELK